MLFLMTGIACFAQRSGIIISATDGHLGKYSGYSYYMNTGTADGTIYPETRWTPGVGFHLGYQFGFKLSNRFWMDASILGKVVQGKAESFDLNGNDVVPWSDKAWIWGLALNGAINYRICSGLYAGIGIEPTSYFKTNKLKENLKGQVFDFPVVLTLGYEFNNGMKLSASYKHGFKPLYDNAFASNIKNNKEFGISLYVPMFK